MVDPIEEVFDGPGRRGHEWLVEEAEGAMRFDPARADRTDHADHWVLSMIRDRRVAGGDSHE